MKNVIQDLMCPLYLLLIYIAAYDSYARLGLANSERIVCQITSDILHFFFFSDEWLLALSIAQSNAWLNKVSIKHRL